MDTVRRCSQERQPHSSPVDRVLFPYSDHILECSHSIKIAGIKVIVGHSRSVTRDKPDLLIKQTGDADIPDTMAICSPVTDKELLQTRHRVERKQRHDEPVGRVRIISPPVYQFEEDW
jgi:hypothetical protein